MRTIAFHKMREPIVLVLMSCRMRSIGVTNLQMQNCLEVQMLLQVGKILPGVA
jgi:hypothetical protein